MAAQTKGQGLL